MPEYWALLPFPVIIHIKSLGRYFDFILMLPNKILFPPLGKLAFIGEENINILGLEAQSLSLCLMSQCQFPY